MQYNGRLYLAKDSRMTRDVFRQSERRANAYKNYWQIEGASAAYSSAQSERLGL